MAKEIDIQKKALIILQESYEPKLKDLPGVRQDGVAMEEMLLDHDYKVKAIHLFLAVISGL